MIPIAKCESGFRQYGPDGLVLFDPSYSMIGVFQISAAHLPHALAMGTDVTTLEGNLAYARYLYNTNGFDPWMSSFSCWGSVASSTTGGTTTSPSSSPTSSISISLGMSSPLVLTVQQTLNKIGYTVSASGPGSIGSETSMLGSLTRNALRRFQCAQNIACSGDESTTGYGLLNDRTYQALLAAAGASTGSSSADKAAEIAKIQSQISSLTSQIDTLNVRLKELTQ
ncbi:MAG: peptidoglycan-binding protein [Patescibacteria group bacterium]